MKTHSIRKYEVAGMTLYGWQGAAAQDFVAGKDRRPPEAYFARQQYELGWCACQGSTEAFKLRGAALDAKDAA
jgi:hypothetical protein